MSGRQKINAMEQDKKMKHFKDAAGKQSLLDRNNP